MKPNKYILFIDESGKSKFSDQGSYFLLCGIIIERELHQALSTFMISLKQKTKIPTDLNLHAFDIFENEKIDGVKLKKKQIDSLFEILTNTVEGSQVKCFIVCMDKTPYSKMINNAAKKISEQSKKDITSKAIIKHLKRNQLHDFLYESLTRKLVLDFGHFLEEEDAYGEVIAESRREDDPAVLSGFLLATQPLRYNEHSTYKLWSKYAHSRITSLTFQNKKGLSFGLELADLFAWAHINNTKGRQMFFRSAAKVKRIEYRLKGVEKVMKNALIKNKTEDITPHKLKNIAADRVSEFTEYLNNFKLGPQ